MNYKNNPEELILLPVTALRVHKSSYSSPSIHYTTHSTLHTTPPLHASEYVGFSEAHPEDVEYVVGGCVARWLHQGWFWRGQSP